MSRVEFIFVVGHFVEIFENVGQKSPESGSGRGSLSASCSHNAATSPMHNRNLPPRFLPRSVRCKTCLSGEDTFRSEFRDP